MGTGTRACADPAIILRVYRVRLGHHSMSPVYESGQQMFRGVKSIPHPNYSHPGHSNDLMLIKLNRKVQLSHAVKPINISSHCPSTGTRCLVSGWGTTSSSQRESGSLLAPTRPAPPHVSPALTMSLFDRLLPQEAPVPEYQRAEPRAV